MSWEAFNLAAPEFSIEPDPPAWCGLIYRGKRHLISGVPESAKTLASLAILLTAIRDGAQVAVVDFESGPSATRAMLVDLGATLDEIGEIAYYQPETAPDPTDIADLIESGVDLVLVDASAGAFGVSGLDDEKRRDVELFAALWIAPLHAAGIATIVVDHVTKNAETRGKFAIGSERKVGIVDTHLGLKPVRTLTRGGNGLIEVVVHKDRPGFLRRPVAAELHLESDPDTHRIAWTLSEPAATTAAHADTWRPTVLMERVSQFLQQQAEPVSRRNVEDNVQGKSRDWIRKAIDELIAAGYVAETPGPRGARLVASTRPFTSPDLAPTSPGEVGDDLAHLARPLQGGEVRGEVSPGEHTPGELDEEEAERLLAKHADVAQSAA